MDFNYWPVCENASLYVNGRQVSNLVIPDRVRKISAYAFRGLNNVKAVTIPLSVTEIEQGAFMFMNALTSVTIGDGVTAIRRDAFCGNQGLQTLRLGNSVREIEREAFSGCTGLKVLMLPESVETIGEIAFSCSSLVEIWSLGTNPPQIESGYYHTFDTVDKGRAVVRVPDSAVEAYRSAPGWSDFACIIGFNDPIAKPVIKPDVNSDGVVTVSDITAVIESMLSE